MLTIKIVTEIKKEISFSFTNNKPRKILFDHLPKCGGSSINRFLKKNYLKRKTYNINVNNQAYCIKRFANFSEKKRYSYDLVKGHLTHSLIDYFHPKALKITILRDPVERIISHYYYAKNNPGHYLYPRINKENLSLIEYVSSGVSYELRNWYVSHFLGIPFREAEKNPEASIKLAANIVFDKYDIIGFLDDIEDFADRVYKMANLKYPYSGEQVNKSKRPKRSEISDKTIKHIENINFLDVKFYAEIRKLGRAFY